MKTELSIIIIAGLLLIAVAIGHGRASYARGAEAASIEAEKAAKPLTTASLIKSLASLAERAEGQGMRDEAQAIYAAIAVAAKGTPAKAVCGTDTECAEYDRNLKRLLKK